MLLVLGLDMRSDSVPLHFIDILPKPFAIKVDLKPQYKQPFEIPAFKSS